MSWDKEKEYHEKLKELSNSPHLVRIWEMQRYQNNFFFPGIVEEKEMLNCFLLGLFEEVGELQKRIGLKKHILNLDTKGEDVKSNILEECVDIFKYLVSVLQVYGFNYEEFVEYFYYKTSVVFDRGMTEKNILSSGCKVILMDLDGVVADINKYLMDRRIHKSSYSTHKWKRIKSDLIERGMFKDLEPVEGSVDGIDVIKELGYKIVIGTSRSFWDFSRIKLDTFHWLKKHDILVDRVFFSRNKSELISKLYPASIDVIIEDRLDFAIELEKTRLPILLLNSKNGKTVESKYIKVVDSWDDIVRFIIELGR